MWLVNLQGLIVGACSFPSWRPNITFYHWFFALVSNTYRAGLLSSYPPTLSELQIDGELPAAWPFTSSYSIAAMTCVSMNYYRLTVPSFHFRCVSAVVQIEWSQAINCVIVDWARWRRQKEIWVTSAMSFIAKLSIYSYTVEMGLATLFQQIPDSETGRRLYRCCGLLAPISYHLLISRKNSKFLECYATTRVACTGLDRGHNHCYFFPNIQATRGLMQLQGSQPFGRHPAPPLLKILCSFLNIYPRDFLI
jgi:hypothetical protein